MNNVSKYSMGAFHERRSNLGSAEPGSTLIVDLNQVQVMMCSTNVKLGSAEPRWLYVLDADWSDLIKISDVTRTVYISFDARAAASSERIQPVVRNVFFALIF